MKNNQSNRLVDDIATIEEILPLISPVLINLQQQYDVAAAELAEINQAGVANATISMRDGKYAYLVFPMKDGQRKKKYIGSSQAAIDSAKAQIDRYQRQQQLFTQLSALEHQVSSTRSTLESLRLRLVGKQLSFYSS